MIRTPLYHFNHNNITNPDNKKLSLIGSINWEIKQTSTSADILRLQVQVQSTKFNFKSLAQIWVKNPISSQTIKCRYNLNQNFFFTKIACMESGPPQSVNQFSSL